MILNVEINYDERRNFTLGGYHKEENLYILEAPREAKRLTKLDAEARDSNYTFKKNLLKKKKVILRVSNGLIPKDVFISI